MNPLPKPQPKPEPEPVWHHPKKMKTHEWAIRECYDWGSELVQSFETWEEALDLLCESSNLPIDKEETIRIFKGEVIGIYNAPTPKQILKWVQIVPYSEKE